MWHLARAILRRSSYRAIEDCNGQPGPLLTRERRRCTIHLLLTDGVPDAAAQLDWAGARLSVARPQMEVLYMPGYIEDLIVHHGILDSGIAYLQKPLVPELLARRVPEVLGSPKRGW